MRFPWGKFKGRAVRDVPTSYIVWLLENGTRLPADLHAAMRAELIERFELWPPIHECLTPAELRDVLREVLARGYRALAFHVHPDRGGSTARMQAANELRDWCRSVGLAA